MSDSESEFEGMSGVSESEDDYDDDEDFEATPPKPKAKTKKKPAPKKAAAKKTAPKKAAAKKSPKKAAPKKSTGKRSAPSSAPKGKASKKPKTVSEFAGTEMIYDYLVKQNRPYNHLNIFDNLHRAVKKTMVPKILDKLANEDRVVMKQFKKVKIYHAKQDVFGDFDQDAIDEMDAQIKSETESLREKETLLKQINTACNRLSAVETNDEADSKISALEPEIEAKKERLKQLAGGVDLLSAEEISKFQSAFDRNFKAWRTRRRIGKEMIDVILEAAEHKTPKQMMKELDVETDKDIGVNISDYSKFLPSR